MEETTYQKDKTKQKQHTTYESWQLRLKLKLLSWLKILVPTLQNQEYTNFQIANPTVEHVSLH